MGGGSASKTRFLQLVQLFITFVLFVNGKISGFFKIKSEIIMSNLQQRKHIRDTFLYYCKAGTDPGSFGERSTTTRLDATILYGILKEFCISK